MSDTGTASSASWTPEVPDLSIAEAATFIGVSRARIYQRVTGRAGQWPAGRPLQSILRETKRPGTKDGHQRRISIADALAWRMEREVKQQPVGPITPEMNSLLAKYREMTKPPVGMPAINPF
jgi:hypothetical protein